MTRSRDVATQGGLVLLNTTTVSAAASVSISNIFDSTYSQYRILVSLNSSSANQTMLFRCRENTTDKATDYIGGTFEISYLAATTATGNNSGTSFVMATNMNITDPSIGSWDIYRTPTRCSMTGLGWNYQGAKTYFTGGQNATMSNFTGFSIFVGSGTMTGLVKVYGYK